MTIDAIARDASRERARPSCRAPCRRRSSLKRRSCVAAGAGVGRRHRARRPAFTARSSNGPPARPKLRPVVGDLLGGEKPAQGLVDVITARGARDAVGHQGERLCIAIVQAFHRLGPCIRAGRRRIRSRRPPRGQVEARSPPEIVCARRDPATLGCRNPTGRGVRFRALPLSHYGEGRPVTPDSVVVDAMAPALQRVRDLQSDDRSACSVRRAPSGEAATWSRRSAISSPTRCAKRSRGLMWPSITTREGAFGPDIPDGALTFGRLYDVFPSITGWCG